MSPIELAQTVEDSAFAATLRESAYIYPLMEGTHVLSLALAVGIILWFDLRLVGLILRGEPVKAMYASLRPWLFLGFTLMIVTGVVLLLTRPAHILANTLFQIKLGLLVLCLVNIMVYHFVIDRSSPDSADGSMPPTAARVAGGLSLLLWFSVIAVGRFMAYSL